MRWFTKSARHAATAPPGTAAVPVRLARLLSKSGAMSRGAAEAAIAAGRVQVNGKIVTDGGLRLLPEADRVLLDGRPLAPAAAAVWLLNKPVGVLTTARDPRGRRTVYDLLPPQAAVQWLAPVGRLDQDSGGLLLFTNDTRLAHALTHPDRHVPKTYRVKVVGRAPDLAPFRAPMTLDAGEMTRPAAAVRLVRAGTTTSTFDLVLTEGKNRQVRRMCAAQGLVVRQLVRTCLGPLALGDLKPGAARRLTDAEVAALRRAAGCEGESP